MPSSFFLPFIDADTIADAIALGESRLLLEEEAHLFDLNRHDRAIRRYLKRLVDLNESAKLRVKIHQVHLVALNLERRVIPGDGDIGD